MLYRDRELLHWLQRGCTAFALATTWRPSPHQSTTTELLFRRVAWMPTAEPMLRCLMLPSPPPGHRPQQGAAHVRVMIISDSTCTHKSVHSLRIQRTDTNKGTVPHAHARASRFETRRTQRPLPAASTCFADHFLAHNRDSVR